MSAIHRHPGEVLAELREARGLTQTALANALDVTPAHISRIETGNRNLTLGLIEKAARFFGVSPSVFLPGEEEAGHEGCPSDRPQREVTMDGKGRARPCPNCGDERYGDRARYCPKCGWALFNFCIAADRHINDPSANRCELCGKRTWWSFESQEEVDRLEIPDDAHSSRSIEVAQEIT